MNEEQTSHPSALISAYALGALDPGEADAVAAHVASCTDCQADLAGYQSVVDALSLAVPEAEPSPDLRARLLAQIGQRPVTASGPESGPAGPGWLRALFGQPQWRPAFALAVLVLILGSVWLWQGRTPGPTNRIDLIATDAAPGASGVIEFRGEGQLATLSVTGLPALDESEQYQLWLIKDGQRASGAVFSVDSAGSATISVQSEQPLATYGAFGVTIEPAGGSPGPTGARVLGHNL